ncbi:hypothetical protein [Endozoicomonas sp. SCSIO W0465]|uniref:hypothetical protein n=1 Tax=Endozoicomonas sp. SCSIO W0465 TaxID=2918516 RepID=UPI0020752076|nr:hypothetical protein [Endozoicomonas sp. SCSIO W0465]USE35211.1 hypothetical protein MJO57_24380 [Endozoicomonas sp. SCSIO W0465]
MNVSTHKYETFTQFIPMMERQKEIYGRVPRQTSGDGGYACRANLEKAKTMGISDVAFNNSSYAPC